MNEQPTPPPAVEYPTPTAAYAILSRHLLAAGDISVEVAAAMCTIGTVLADHEGAKG